MIRLFEAIGITAGIFALAGCESNALSVTPGTGEEVADPIAVPIPFERPDYDRPDIDALWDFNNPASTHATFSQILEEAKDAKDWVFVAEVLTQIARTQALQRQFSLALKTLEAADELITEQRTLVYLRYLIESGRVYNYANQPRNARPYLLQAYDLAQLLGEEYHAIDAAQVLGTLERGPTGLAWNERAIALTEASLDPRARNWLGSLYSNTGWIYHDLGQYSQALQFFETALEHRTAQGNPHAVLMARWSVARCLRSLERQEEALMMQYELLEEFDAANQNDGLVHEELGECLLLLERGEEARPHFARAYSQLGADPWLRANERNRLRRLDGLSRRQFPISDSVGDENLE